MDKPTTDNIQQAMQLEIENLSDKLEAAESKLKDARELLKYAKCPNNCKSGYSDIVYDDCLGIDHFASTECQWCRGRNELQAKLDK